VSRKVQLGIYPTNGMVIDGSILQTARIDRAGAYSTTGTVLGDNIRTGPWRLYSSIDDVVNGSAFAAGSPEVMAHKAGHTVILSWGQGSYPSSAYAKANTGTSWWAAMAAGYIDTQLKNMFSKVHALPFAQGVTPVSTTTGSKEAIPGSTKKGVTPSEVVLCPLSHEPNIPGTQFGTPAEFCAGMKHVMQLYDTWVGGGTKRIKFTNIISYPGSNVYAVCGGKGGGANYYGVGTGNDISGGGARPVDYPGWDLYFPGVEKSNGPATPGAGSGGNGNSVYFGAHFGQLNSWVYGTQAAGAKGGGFTTQRQVIGEIACRIQTAKSSDGTAPDSTWPDKFWNDATNGFTKWNQNNALAGSGDHPLIYVCLYAAASLMKTGSTYGNGASGNIDNSIIPDTTTYTTTFQNGGYSLRPSFTAFRTCLIANGNETMTGTAGVTPTGLSVTTPAAGVRSATLTWTTNAANVSYNLYVNNVLTQTGLSGGSAPVSIPSTTPLPHSDTLKLTGVGSDNSETALSSSVTVNYTAGAGTIPATPAQPTVSNVGQTTATFSVTAVTGATGYAWYLDGNVSTPDYTSSNASFGATALAAGSHTVKCAAYNAAGTSSQSVASSSFTMSTAPDTTPPNVPTGLAAPVIGSSQVVLSWNAATDPTVAGATTSGMGTYIVQRSFSPVAGTGTTLSPNNLTSPSFVDSAPPSSSAAAVTVYYTVAAVDVAGNPSAFSSPLTVVLPQAVTSILPIAVPFVPSVVNFGQLFTVDDGGSVAGSGGNIVNWSWSFGDGLGAATANARHSYQQDTDLSPHQFTGSLVVIDESGQNSQPASFTILATPTDSGGVFPYTGAPMFAKAAGLLADTFNNVDMAQEAALASLDSRLAATESDLAQIGDPLTPRRHNNALFASVNPEAAGSAFTLAAGTMYVIRSTTINGASFSTVRWTQTSSTVSAGVANSFWAVYDVSGTLISSATATDCSSQWLTQQECSYTFDGAPFDPPLGADNTVSQQIPASNEFFVAFYLGAVGTNHPQIAIGSNFANAVNLGTSTTAITPSQDNIQSVPLFSTAANTPSTNLQPPTTLGALTRVNASMLTALYA
jgi:hypothetical protein